MDLRLTNKLALITGSTKGVGKAIAAEAAREGTDVIIDGYNEAEVAEVIKEIQTMFPNTHPQTETVDIPTESQQATLPGKFPKADTLVNNTGIFEPMEYQDIDDATWEKFFTVNMLSGNTLARAYLLKMLTQDFGRIIFITNGEAVMPSGEMPQYNMTKTVNLSLAKSLSNLTAGTHVTVNTVAPGSTLTEGVEKMLEGMYADSGIPREDWKKDFMRDHHFHSQIQRPIRLEKIDRFVTFVANPDSFSFSGEALRIDGGSVPTIF